MTVLYGILVVLLLISGLLLVSGQPIYGLVVLAIATLLNARLLALRRKLNRRGMP
jgi:formate hydrogenlyase subunit 3/multisubunit Na+/H+ antiporter MnhD subunit